MRGERRDRRPGGSAGEAQTPIRHFVVLMQENHSFDNYFGTYPGANGIPPKTCMPVDARAERQWPLRPAVSPGRPGRPRPGPRSPHARPPVRRGTNGRLRAGRLDRPPEAGALGHGALRRPRPALLLEGGGGVRAVRSLLRLLGGRQRAQSHVLGHRAARCAGACRARSRGRASASCPPSSTGSKQPASRGSSTSRTTTQRRSVAATGTAELGVQAVRVPLLNFSRYVNDPKLFGRIVNLDEYYEDLRSGNLPEVAYIAPSRSSEHPPGRVEAGEKLVRRLLTALAMSDAWKSSAFLWTYDDWGGWFDHVRPPTVDGARYGFRVPALLVSPYARKGHIDSTRLETTSILRFIEDNWELKPLARRDARAHSFVGAFDFSRPARAPQDPRRRANAGASAGGPALGDLHRLRRRAAGRRRAVRLGPAAPRIALARPAGCQLAAVAVALSALGAAPAGAQPISTVPEVPGMRFSLDGRVFEAGRDGRAHPPPGLADSRAALRALDTEIAPGDPGEIRPLVPRPHNRRDQALLPGHAHLRGPQRAPGRPARGHVGGRARQPGPSLPVRGRPTALAAGQPGGPREPRHKIHRRLLLGGEGLGRRLVGRAPRPTALLSGQDTAGWNCGCCCSPLV